MKVTLEAPLCAMCPRQARWLVKRQEYARYCSGAHCSNKERNCRACGHVFWVNTDGAGTAYCSLECKRIGYGAAHRAAGPTGSTCAWCGTFSPGRNLGLGKWPYVCNPCTQPIKHVLTRLRQHRVPLEMARALADNPYCELCGAEMLNPSVRDSGHHLRPSLSVDHDHNCCPGPFSCGQCVRGLICGSCNLAMGSARDDPEVLRAMARYLQRARHVRDVG